MRPSASRSELKQSGIEYSSRIHGGYGEGEKEIVIKSPSSSSSSSSCLDLKKKEEDKGRNVKETC